MMAGDGEKGKSLSIPSQSKDPLVGLVALEQLSLDSKKFNQHLITTLCREMGDVAVNECE